MDHLTSIDASFLHFESPETPMHVGSLILLELPAGYSGHYYEDVKALIAKRMHLVRLFHRKLAAMPFELADPLWVDDDDVDLDYHVRHATLPKPGTMVQLEQHIARVHSSLLDRSRPLWEFHVIEGLADGRVGVYVKAHHSGIDGKAGMELVKIVYDTSPVPRTVAPPRRRLHAVAGRQLGIAELLRAGVVNAAKQYVRLVRLVPRGANALATTARIVYSRRASGGRRPINLGFAPRTLLNAPITNQRSYATLSVPMEDVKALGRRVGGTVNTIVMAMCAGALRRFLAEREPLPAKPLIAAVPVSLRAADDGSTGNQVSIVRVDLATDIADPRERFGAIHASSEAAKAVVRQLRPILGVDVPVVGSPWLMTGLSSLVVRSGLLNVTPQLANVVISNVPGPPQMYLAGARATSFYPCSIPYHGMGLNVTVHSYAGQLEFGLVSCRRLLSHDELREIVGYLLETLEQIRGFESADEAAAGMTDKGDKATKTPKRKAPKRPRPAANDTKVAVPTRRPARKRSA